MRAKLLGIVLTTPIAISSFASTETLSFTPDNINADISLGTLSGKTKERVYLAEEGGRKVSWICPYISRHLLSLNPLLACCRRYSRGER